MQTKTFDSKLTQFALHANTVLLGIGFYMLLPLLNPYLYNEKMFTAVLVGYIASAREMSNNISMVFGGPLGNILGVKATMIMGICARVIAFVILGVADSFPLFILGGALIGVGAALFIPASTAYYDAISTDENRVRMFSIYNILDTSGSVIGPAMGSILVAATSFRVMCLLCAALYIMALINTFIFLPNLKNEEAAKAGIVGNIMECAKNKAFVKFLVFTSVISFIILQRDLTIPVKLSVIQPDYSVGFMYTLASFIGIVIQLPMVKFFKSRFNNYKIFAFASVLYTAGISLLGFAVNIPMLYVGCIVYAIGHALYTPIKSTRVAEFAGKGKVAGYFGFQGLVGVVIAFLGNMIGGYLYDFAALQTGILSLTPWFIFIVVGAAIVTMFTVLGKKENAK